MRFAKAVAGCALALGLLIASPAHAESGTCSKTTALHVSTRLHLADATLGRSRLAQVLCGPFTGPGSRGMVISAALPSCGGSYMWTVLRFKGSSWRVVMKQNHGAILAKAGADIVERQGVLLAGDAHCFPSESKTRTWHWNGSRFAATRWAVSPQTSLAAFLSPDRAVWCMFNSLDAPYAWCGTRGQPQRSARLTVDGALTLCSDVCLQNWDDGAPVLRQGWTSERDGFRCASEADGIRCTVIGTGKGFLIGAGGVTAV